jgi:hypothetical protein
MQLIYSTAVSLHVNVISDLIGAFVPFCHAFENSVTTEITLSTSETSHKQPFLLPHNCEFGDLPRVVSVTQTNYLLHVTPVTSAISCRKVKCLLMPQLQARKPYF